MYTERSSSVAEGDSCGCAAGERGGVGCSRCGLEKELEEDSNDGLLV
jgi:hypothetical protein